MFEEYDHQKLYLVACSGGPDSMALLDMLFKNNFSLMVAHVNYKTRNESDLEEKLVQKYCKDRNIPCFVAIFDNIYHGSFEVAAREFRYNFFAKIYFENHCNGLFVAHHKDDVLETYELKKQRNVINESYLILKETKIKKMIVYRPLLNDFYKEDLLNYCKKNNIPYSLDSTNFLDIHPRNVIRKKLSLMNKELVYKEALEEEGKLQNTRKKVQEFINYYPCFPTILLQDKDDLFLRIFLYELCEKSYKKYINKSIFLTLKDYIKSNKANLYYKIAKDYYLEKNYGVITFRHHKMNNYNYIFEKLEYLTTKDFKIVNSGLKMQGVYVSEQDFPITIRTFKETDTIMLKNGNKKLNRLFIDKKVPLLDRYEIPLIENSQHEIIFVYGLYRKYGLKNVKNNLFISK